MNKSDDIELFVQVVKSGGLAAAGQVLGLSPASMTARVNNLEKRYNARLFNRTTRKVTLTNSGQKFYNIALRIVADLFEVESILKQEATQLSGRLKITAPSDFARQYVTPALAKFVSLHAKVETHLVVNDGIININEHDIDLAIRFGNLGDSNLVAVPLAGNRRHLCASPDYIKQFGLPETPEDLYRHKCLVLERLGEPLNEWRFKEKNKTTVVKVNPAFIANDGAIIRQSAVAGMGIAMKSYWDIKSDLQAGRLITVLDNYTQGFQRSDNDKVALQLVYPERHYQPKQVVEFIDFFKGYCMEAEKDK